MTPHEAESGSDTQNIAERSAEQHRHNVDAELAQRGLLETSGLTHLSRQRTLDYIRDLESQLEKTEDEKPTGNSL